jgi:hypothetical protein
MSHVLVDRHRLIVSLTSSVSTLCLYAIPESCFSGIRRKSLRESFLKNTNLYDIRSFESEDEGEQFFGKIGRFLKKAAPVLKKVAKVAIPLVGTAIAGPAGGAIGCLASKALGEGEFEAEAEDEFEGVGEQEYGWKKGHRLTTNGQETTQYGKCSSTGANDLEAGAHGDAQAINCMEVLKSIRMAASGCPAPQTKICPIRLTNLWRPNPREN